MGYIGKNVLSTVGTTIYCGHARKVFYDRENPNTHELSGSCHEKPAPWSPVGGIAFATLFHNKQILHSPTDACRPYCHKHRAVPPPIQHSSGELA